MIDARELKRDLNACFDDVTQICRKCAGIIKKCLKIFLISRCVLEQAVIKDEMLLSFSHLMLAHMKVKISTSRDFFVASLRILSPDSQLWSPPDVLCGQKKKFIPNNVFILAYIC